MPAPYAIRPAKPPAPPVVASSDPRDWPLAVLAASDGSITVHRSGRPSAYVRGKWGNALRALADQIDPGTP